MIKTKVNKRKQARTNETASIEKKKVAGAGEKSVETFKGIEDKSKSEKMPVSDTESDNLNGTNFEKNELFKVSGEQRELPAKSDKKENIEIKDGESNKEGDNFEKDEFLKDSNDRGQPELMYSDSDHESDGIFSFHSDSDEIESGFESTESDSISSNDSQE